MNQDTPLTLCVKVRVCQDRIRLTCNMYALLFLHPKSSFLDLNGKVRVLVCDR